MKDWLLKEEKNKVGRPKLADENVLKKAKMSIFFSILLCVFLSFYFYCNIKGEQPLKFAYHLTLEKVFGAIENKDGFIVSYKYDNDYNYVMEFNVPSSVSNYSGSYKYTLYEMDKNTWKEKETKEFDRNTKSFKINVKSLKNQNKTWKIKLQIVNASSIKKSYAPAGWSFVDSDKNSDMYTYKVFTVKGYYSPVSLNELKEAKKSKDKISVDTKKNDPRCFVINLPANETYDIKIKYTDLNNKSIILSDDKVVTGTKTYKVPNLDRTSLVTIDVYNSKISSLKLSNWKEKTDKGGNTYITNTYVLKPEAAYKN